MFTVFNLQINRGSTSANAQGGSSVTILHTYKDLTLTVATIKLLFPDYLGQGVSQDVLSIGDHMLVEGSDTTIFCKIVSLAPFVLGPDLFSGASGLSVGPTVVATDNNAAIITGDTLQIEKADKTHSGIVTEIAQDIGGEKTLWANTTIIPANDFIVAGEGDPPINLLIKTQDELGGIQIQTDSSSNVIGYTFGSVDNDPNVGGIYYSDTGYPNSSATVSILGPQSALYLDTTGVTSPTDFNVDIVNEFTANGGVTIEGVNVKGTTLTLADPNVYIDNGVSLANQIKFNFDTSDNDYLHYDKSTRTFSYATSGVNRISVSPTTTTIDNLAIAQSAISVDTINEFTPANGITMTNLVTAVAGVNADIINEKTASNGTIINGTNIKGTTITLADPLVFWDNGVAAAGEVRFGLDTNDRLAYVKSTNLLRLDIGGVAKFQVSSAGGVQSAGTFDTIGATPLLIGTTHATAVQFPNVPITNFMNANTNENIPIGTDALISNTSGSQSVAIGDYALTSNTTGSFIVALGQRALSSNISGDNLVAIGVRASIQNTTGNYNVSIGRGAAESNTTGSGTIAIGGNALLFNNGDGNVVIGTGSAISATGISSNTIVGNDAANVLLTGVSNLILGAGAGNSYNGAESNNILLSNAGTVGESAAIHIGTLGTHTTNFQAGIYGVTVAASLPVLIDSNGQMGTVLSLRSKKENIVDISAQENSEIIKKLQPVKFDYIGVPDKHQQYGLIADDVEKICPELCAYNEKDELQTVHYSKITMMLLKEVQTLQEKIELLERNSHV